MYIVLYCSIDWSNIVVLRKLSEMAQFQDDDDCRAFHLELGKETFQLKGKELMAYITKEVQLWREKGQFTQQREDKIREATLARQESNANRALASEAAER